MQGSGSHKGRMPEFNPGRLLSRRGLWREQGSWPRFSPLVLWLRVTGWILMRLPPSEAQGMAQDLVFLSQLKRSNRVGQGKEPGLWTETSFRSLPMVTWTASHETWPSAEETQGTPTPCSGCCWKSPRCMGQEHSLSSPLNRPYLSCKVGRPDSSHRAAGLRH